MAQPKIYEIMFLLRAQMDSSMKQMSLVGGQIKELEEKIQQYNNTLRDISAYRDQKDAVKTYEEALRKQEAVLADVTGKFNEATAAVRNSQQAYQKHKENIDSLNLKIAEEKAKIAELNTAMKQNGADTKELGQKKAECQERIARYNVELENEKQSLNRLKQELKDNKAAEKELLEQKNQAQNAKDRLIQKLNEERDKLKALSEELRRAGVDTKDLEAAEKSLGQQVKDLTEQQDKLTGFANSVNDLADKFMVLKMAARGIETVLKPLMNFFGAGLDAAAQLEFSMSAVQAVSGATQKEAAALTEVVKKMGAATIYTAEESAQAMQNMALAGWDAQQMISGLPAVIKLAAASGEDLAQMTSIVSDGMNAFQLSGEAAAVKFADVLAKAATSSNTNVSLLGDSLKYVETTAGNLGYSIEDVSLLLAAMANNAQKGAVSGSALNTMLTRMSGANKTADKQMEKMGLSMYYTADAMGHAAGEAKDLKTFTEELRAAFKAFGDDAQSAQIAAYNLAGMRGMRGLMAIVNQSDEQWNRLVNDIYNYSGAANEISSIRMDNYTGQVYLLTSAWDALKTSVGEKFLPVATDVSGVLTNIITGANEFVQGNGDIVRAIAAITGTTLGLTAAISVMATVVQGARLALTALSATKLITLMGGFGSILAAASALGVMMAAVASSADRTVPRLKELNEEARNMETALNESEDAYQKTSDSIEAASNMAGRYIDRLEELQKKSNRTEEEQREYQNTLALLLQTMPELSGCIRQTTDEYGRTTYALETTTDALRANTEEWKKNAAAQAYQEKMSDIYEHYANVLLEAEQRSIDLTAAEEKLRGIEERKKEILERQAELREQNRRFGAMTADAEALPGEYFELEEELKRLAIAERDASLEAGLHRTALRQDEAAAEDARRELERSERAYNNLMGTQENSVDVTKKTVQENENLIAVFESTERGLENVQQAYEETYAEVYKGLSGIFDLFEKVEEKEKTTMKELTDAVSSQTQYFSDYKNNLETLVNAAKEKGIDLSGVWGRITDGSPEAAAAVEAMVQSIQNGDFSALENYVNEYAALQELLQGLSGTVALESEETKSAIEQAGDEIAQAISNTEARDEAFEAMQATVQGYIDSLIGSGNGVGRVSAAIEYMQGVMTKQFGNPQFLYAGTKKRTQTNTVYGLSYGLPPNLADMRQNAGRTPGFASGTWSAPRGLALVGEQGPELMMLAGGERIFPADQTARMLDRSAMVRTIDGAGFGRVDLNLNFTVSERATPETVRALRDYSEDIEASVERAMRKLGIDARRRALV